MITFCDQCANWHEEDDHNPHIVAKAVEATLNAQAPDKLCPECGELEQYCECSEPAATQPDHEGSETD